MRKGLMMGALAAALAVAPAAAEDGVSPASGEYLINFAVTPLRVLAQPVTWTPADWAVAGVAAAGLGGLFLLDESINEWVQDSRSSTTDSLADIFNGFGESYYLAGASIAVWAAGELTDNVRLQRVGLHGVQAIVVAQLLTEATKRIGGRLRPAYTDDSLSFFESYGEGGDSFASGHAATAFALATVISQEYKKDYPWVPYIAYGVATGTALARLNNERHWASDVALGAMWGIGAGWMVSKFSPFRDDRLMVLPTASAEHVGLVAHMRF